MNAINQNTVQDNHMPFYASDNIGQGNLFAALAKAQGQMESAKKDIENSFFKSKYADLAACVEEIKKCFPDNELAYIQIPKPGRKFESRVPYKDQQKNIQYKEISGHTVVILTTIAHSSGEWIAGEVEMEPHDTSPQGIGLTMTYAKRYGITSMTGLASEDDDGNAGSGRNLNQGNVRNKQNTSPESLPDYVFRVGKSKGKTFGELGQDGIQNWVNYWEGKDISGMLLEDFNLAKEYLKRGAKDGLA